MAMKPSTRREFYKLREITHFLLSGGGATPREVENRSGSEGAFLCFFCREPLDDYAADFTTHGNSVGPKLEVKLSIHHIDGNHDNNEDLNKALSHTKCHKSHHRSLANAARAAQEK